MFVNLNISLFCVNNDIKEEIKSQLSFYIEANCSELCKANSQKKYILDKNICINNCNNDKDYIIEYDNICYTECPNGTHVIDNNMCKKDLICNNYYNYEYTDCLDSIPLGYYLNDTEEKTLGKCNIKCSNCTLNSAINNLCISCNNSAGYFGKYNDSLSDNEFINCYNEQPNGYYLDNEENMYIPCHSSCKACTGKGNTDNHQCSDCFTDYILSNGNCEFITEAPTTDVPTTEEVVEAPTTGVPTTEEVVEAPTTDVPTTEEVIEAKITSEPSIEEVTNRAYGFSDETNDNGTNWVGDPARCAKVTEYATSQSVSIRYDDTGWWWLRSPGCNGYGASYVYTYGSIADSGVPVNTTGRGLRPVLHINLQSINLTPQESDPASPTAMSTQSIDSTTTPTTSASVPTSTPFNSASPSGAASATATATAPAVTATPTTAPATATPTATSATATAPATRRPRHSKSPTSATTNPTDKPSAIVTSSTSATPTVSATSSVSASASSGMPSGNKTVLTAAFAKKTYKIKRKKSKKLTIMLMGNKKINTALLTGVFKANKKNRIKTGKVRKKIIANKSSIFCAIMTLKVKAKRKGKVILSGVVFNNKVSAKVKCKVVVR